jgi:hypothetical protein
MKTTRTVYEDNSNRLYEENSNRLWRQLDITLFLHIFLIMVLYDLSNTTVRIFLYINFYTKYFIDYPTVRVVFI